MNAKQFWTTAAWVILVGALTIIATRGIGRSEFDVMYDILFFYKFCAATVGTIFVLNKLQKMGVPFWANITLSATAFGAIVAVVSALLTPISL